jgi:hypothetical protein
MSSQGSTFLGTQQGPLVNTTDLQGEVIRRCVGRRMCIIYNSFSISLRYWALEGQSCSPFTSRPVNRGIP